MALIECPDCHSMVSDEAPACPKCGRPIAQVDPNAPMEETVVYQESPAMFRNRPFSFLLCVLLIPVLVGLIILFIWWLVCRNIRLTITDKRTELRTGLLSKHTIELRHDDIRSVVVRQSFMQRVMGVGVLELSSAAESDFEIAVKGLRNPEAVGDLIQKYQK